jgi:hypothetical protein
VRLENRLYAVALDDGTAVSAAAVIAPALGRSRQQLAAIDLRAAAEPPVPEEGAEIDL